MTNPMLQPKMVIGDELAAAADGRTFDVVEPHRGTVVAQVPLGAQADVDRAVAAAQRAFDGGWSSMAASERGRMMLRFARVVRDHEEELAQLESRQIGKPISGARWEVAQVAKVLEFYAGATTKLHGSTIPVSRPGFDFTLREPIGVVGLIVPWNFPIMMAAWKVGPALAAGNTAILKPASYSPLTALRLGELALEAGLPAGVLNVITGPGPVVGGGLAAHTGIGKIAFTGETATGQEIMRTAAGTIKKVSLELGGKSPCIVLDDADLETSAKRIAWGRFLNAGQTCVAPDYVLVTPGLRQPLERALGEAIDRFFGPDPRQSPDFGRLVSHQQFDRLDRLLAGVEILKGGERDRDSRYLAPTLVRGEPDQALMQEEIFGPVLPLLEVAHLGEALDFIRGRPAPLALYLFSRSEAAREQLLRCSQSGGVCFNDVVFQAGLPALPFGGVGASGLGRYHGQSGFDSLSNLRSVLQRPFALDLPWRYAPYGDRLKMLRRLLG